MNCILQNAAVSAAQPGAGGGIFTAFEDRDSVKQVVREKLKDKEFSLECTILRKKIKPVNGTNRDKIERVIFCSELRQIKGFNKRKHKHEVKTKRTKKTSLKEKMQTSKQ